MGIWIRSQDKETIMNCNELGIVFKDNKSIYSNGYVLGTYSSRKKALKVLDMIQSFINNELIRDYMVFQMPQDDEV